MSATLRTELNLDTKLYWVMIVPRSSDQRGHMEGPYDNQETADKRASLLVEVDETAVVLEVPAVIVSQHVVR